MTRNEINALTLDELRVECAKALGCTPVFKGGQWRCGCTNLGGYETAEHSNIEYGTLKWYASDISAAWVLLEALEAIYSTDIDIEKAGGAWHVWFASIGYVGNGETLPIAICRAFLAAKNNGLTTTEE